MRMPVCFRSDKGIVDIISWNATVLPTEADPPWTALDGGGAPYLENGYLIYPSASNTYRWSYITNATVATGLTILVEVTSSYVLNTSDYYSMNNCMIGLNGSLRNVFFSSNQIGAVWNVGVTTPPTYSYNIDNTVLRKYLIQYTGTEIRIYVDNGETSIISGTCDFNNKVIFGDGTGHNTTGSAAWKSVSIGVGILNWSDFNLI